MPDKSHSESSPPPPGAGQPLPPAVPPKSKWRRFVYRWLKRLAIVAVVLILLSASLLVTAEHQTSKPQFCGSCHIMEPYYATWQADLHGGKLDVACVDCHYAPGQRNTINSQLRGLSQVASYFSGRYGSSRPRAHVDNRSCMTSKCHGDMGFMDKEIAIGTVTFVHAKHLQLSDQKLAATQQQLEQTTQMLRPLLGDKHFAEIDEIAHQAIPAGEQLDRMQTLGSGWQAKAAKDQLAKYAQLLQQQVRVNQLRDLQCTNCHSYGAPESQARNEKGPALAGKKTSAHHFSVKKSSCYTCHFSNQSFNTGTGTCLLCHTLPTREIMVHKELTAKESTQLNTPELSKKSIRMDHRTILERKVACISCHADVAMENSLVTRRDCERCHDQPEYFKNWEQPITLDRVTEYHALHVPEQRAKCLDCHSEIHHQLVPMGALGAKNEPGFLSSVIANCANCHPNQHLEQLELLSGVGGVGVPKSDPNLMFGSRTNCLGCHTDHTVGSRGGEVVRGNVNGCIACHGDRYKDTFKKWQQGLELSLTDAGEAYEKASKALDKAKDITPEGRTKVTTLLAGARADLQLVKTGNGVHNVMYSMELLDSVTRRCQQVMTALAKESRRKP